MDYGSAGEWAGNGKIGCPLPVMGPSYDAMTFAFHFLSFRLSPLAFCLLSFADCRLSNHARETAATPNIQDVFRVS
jgi:hypothetical protein